MIQKEKKLIAGDGKCLKRISDGWIAGKEVILGKAFYIGGKKLDESILELPEHYEEIDEPLITDFQPLTVDADSVIVEVMAEQEQPTEEEPEVENEPVVEEQKPRIVITGQDFITMQEKLDKIMAILSPEQLEKLEYPDR